MRPRPWMTGLLAGSLLGMATPQQGFARLTCEELTARRVERFATAGARQVARCLRRSARHGTACPDARLTESLARLRARVARTLERRCPGTGGDALLAAAEADLLCTTLGLCGAPFGAITVRVTGGGSGAAAPAGAGDQRSAFPRALDVNAGWTGLVHHVQILEGAEYTAELGDCEGSDTLCTLDGATAGTPFGAPSPLAPGGVPVCVVMDFASDVAGTFDRASGDLMEEAQIHGRLYLGDFVERACPACVPAAGDPSLNEAGTCAGGANDGAACVVEGLADPGFGGNRGTSGQCPPAAAAQIGEFTSVATASSGAFAFTTSSASPPCTAPGFSGLRCLCDTCDDPAHTTCTSDADCPAVEGAPGTCGGLRCLGGPRDGLPCASAAACADAGGGGHPCARPGAPTQPNACLDGVCTATPDGGVCMLGPTDNVCALQYFRGCFDDADCPLPGDACVFVARSCFPDTIEVEGTPDPPVNGIAHPTLVGGMCFGYFESAAVNTVAGFPGPLTYVWPAEVTLGE